MSQTLFLANWGALLLALGMAGLFKPWLVLRHRPLQSPWLGAMVILPWVWWLQQLLPSGVALRIGGACLLVLMFGWPLAIWSLPVVAVGTALIEVLGPPFGHMAPTHSVAAVVQVWLELGPTMIWTGVIPATLALGIGLAIRRWAPQHLFVYILGRGFFGTALAISLTGVLGWLANRVPDSMSTEEWLLGHWLLGWGEAISTGMLTSIFVAFKPQWLLTYSDARYLPPPGGDSQKG
ncbi:MAG: hypothetical protein KGN37_04215 [Burkholderiales bacterium]|nr:hypothetical protein [Burkholderiales bacterium]HET8694273.1 hypothetical protein [Aquabacterium sp.]